MNKIPEYVDSVHRSKVKALVDSAFHHSIKAESIRTRDALEAALNLSLAEKVDLAEALRKSRNETHLLYLISGVLFFGLVYLAGRVIGQ